jgi:hypothetical protein
MSEEPDWERRRQRASDPATSPEEHDRFLRDPDHRVRAAAAEHATPEELRLLARDPRAEVRSVVAADKSTPPDVLAALVGDRSANVRWWLSAGAKSQGNREVLRRLSADKDHLVASTAKAALDDMRLYRRVLDLPEKGLAALAHRYIQRRQRD